MEDVFIEQGKHMSEHSIDKQRHLTTSGNTVVADWIAEKIK